MLAKCISEPYRLFFPIGILLLFVGVSIWLPSLANEEYYPLELHRMLMINGFMGFCIAGFLMTAIPQFSKTDSALGIEVLLYFLGSMAAMGVNMYRDYVTPGLPIAIQAALLLRFVGVRIFKRQQNPPFSFIFVVFGLIIWMVAGIFENQLIPDAFQHEAFFTFLILGIGTRLIPGLLGHVEIVKSQREIYEKAPSILKSVPATFYLKLCMLLASYFVEDMMGNILRFAVILWIAVKYWKILKKPTFKTAHAKAIWAFAWLFTLYPLLPILWEDGDVHGKHALFITGVTLITFLVATRVIRAHGSLSKELESHKGLLIFVGLIILASSTRVTAILMPDGYYGHLTYSAFVLIVAIIVWLGILFKYRNSKDEDA